MLIITFLFYKKLVFIISRVFFKEEIYINQIIVERIYNDIHLHGKLLLTSFLMLFTKNLDNVEHYQKSTCHHL